MIDTLKLHRGTDLWAVIAPNGKLYAAGGDLVRVVWVAQACASTRGHSLILPVTPPWRLAKIDVAWRETPLSRAVAQRLAREVADLA